MIHAYASMEHYATHIVPIWNALTRRRGTFFVVPRRTMFDTLAEYGIVGRGGAPYRLDDLVIVAGGTDLAAIRHAVLLEHGAGQSYTDLAHVAWSGGAGRDNVRLFVVPNHHVANANLARYPDVPNIVAAPRVEHLMCNTPSMERSLVVFGRHWTSELVPELSTAWPHHFPAIRAFCTTRPDVALHFHPRCADVGRALAKEWGIPYLERFEDVVARAAVYIVDNSSTGFEFAAMPGPRPVVWLNAPHYRRDIEQGLRFWRNVDVGDQVDEPDDLEAVIDNALNGWSPWRYELQQEHVVQVFPFILGSAERAAYAIEAIAP